MNVVFDMNRILLYAEYMHAQAEDIPADKSKYLHTISSKKSKVHDKIQYAYGC